MNHWSAVLLFTLGCSEYEFTGKTDAASGSGPQIEVDPQLVDFGLHVLDESPSESQVIAVRNIGDGPLTVESVSLTGASGPFTLTSLSGLTLAPDEESSFVATWTPESAGTDVAQAHVHSDDPERPVVAVELIGVSEAGKADGEPNIAVTPAHHDFGIVGGASTATVTLEVHNSGDADLVIHNVHFLSLIHISEPTRPY